MAVGDAYVFPGFLTPVLTLLFFPKPPTTFLTCFCRGERRKYAGKKSRLNRGSNLQPPGHESDTLTTEPPGRGTCSWALAPAHSHSVLLFIDFADEKLKKAVVSVNVLKTFRNIHEQIKKMCERERE